MTARSLLIPLSRAASARDARTWEHAASERGPLWRVVIVETRQLIGDCWPGYRKERTYERGTDRGDETMSRECNWLETSHEGTTCQIGIWDDEGSACMGCVNRLLAQRKAMAGALEIARHSLAALHGLQVEDTRGEAGHPWTIDEDAAIAAIDAALDATEGQP